jgi:broad specificity phosphatase PhoE
MSETSQNTGSNPFMSRANATEILLIRHADALPDPTEVVPGGSYDDQPLSAKGRAQAEALAQRWGSIKLKAIYSSPLRRTIETATPLANLQALDIIPIDGVREINIGSQFTLEENLSPAETAAALRERLDRIIQLAAIHGSWDAVNTEERSTAFRKRVVEAMDSLALKHTGDRIAVFSHGGAINIYISEVLGVNRDFFFPCGNTSVTFLRIFKGQDGKPQRLLVSLNELSHLRDVGLLKED